MLEVRGMVMVSLESKSQQAFFSGRIRVVRAVSSGGC